MPNFNQTGPEGQGPMTGRRMGRCTGNVALDANPADSNTKSTAPNADARPGDPVAGAGQPLGMGMARRRGFGGGGGGRGGFGAGRGRGRGRW